MSEFKNYANHNTMTVTGKCVNPRLAEGPKGKFLSLTLLTHLSDEDKATAIRFTTTDRGMMKLFDGGYLNKRMMTVTGHVVSFATTYVKDGAVDWLKYPQIKLGRAVVFDGGLGPIPKKDNSERTMNIAPPAMPQPMNPMVPEDEESESAAAPVDAQPAF